FKRGFVWRDSDEDIVSPSVLFSETAAPLPGPPPDVMNDPVILKALSEHKDLLKIQTPYDVDKLSSFLSFHPNRPFIKSVLEGLKFGFWP
ncbi:hypothetical protein EV361DRAFT_756676, partial [Lentinula raphanica]